jgi:hypothetical protein
MEGYGHWIPLEREAKGLMVRLRALGFSISDACCNIGISYPYAQ